KGKPSTVTRWMLGSATQRAIGPRGFGGERGGGDGAGGGWASPAGRSVSRCGRRRAVFAVPMPDAGRHDHARHAPSPETSAPIISVSVGNTRARIGLHRGSELVESSVHPSTDAAGLAAAAVTLAERAEGEDNPVVVMSS